MHITRSDGDKEVILVPCVQNRCGCAKLELTVEGTRKTVEMLWKDGWHNGSVPVAGFVDKTKPEFK